MSDMYANTNTKKVIILVQEKWEKNYYFMFAMQNCFLSNDESSAVGVDAESWCENLKHQQCWQKKYPLRSFKFRDIQMNPKIHRRFSLDNLSKDIFGAPKIRYSYLWNSNKIFNEF